MLIQLLVAIAARGDEGQAGIRHRVRHESPGIFFEDLLLGHPLQEGSLRWA